MNPTTSEWSPGMKRLILLIGLGIGYVLGSKAGREQYRKIKDSASKTWQSPAVRSAAEKVEAFVDDKAPALGGVAHTVLGSSGSSTSGSTGSSTSGNTGSSTSGNTGSSTTGAPSPDVVSDVNLGDDLRLDTDLGNEGERPA
jgi:hypothetical protein